MSNGHSPDRLLGESPSFMEVLELVSQIAPLVKPVLIVGERGTGKELIAARLHYLSSRWDQEYVKMNCAAISESLLETELFGHDAGAFTGANKLHKGRFERAHQGSLFLDELANTSPLVQEKLLRIIEYGEFERVGGSRTMTTDVRLICATNEDLPALARHGRFRDDLLDRLAFDVITLPPLRERAEDVMMLAEHFAMTMSGEIGREYFPGFSDAAREVLLTYSWPGNIRELKNVVERAVYRSTDPEQAVEVITLDPFASPFRPGVHAAVGEATSTAPAASTDLAAQDGVEAGFGVETSPGATIGAVVSPGNVEFPIDFRQAVTDYEMALIQQALASSQFNQKKTADALGVTYHQLRGYLKKYDLLPS
jgi:psp operon transcriptional activator